MRFQQQVEECLNTAEGRASVSKRRKSVCSLSEAIKKLPRLPKLTGAPHGTFSVNQTSAAKGHVSVQINGAEVGRLRARGANRVLWFFTPTCRELLRQAEDPLEWQWNYDRHARAEIVGYLKRAQARFGVKSIQERQIQWSLAAMLSASRPKPQVLKFWRPVAWNKHYTEVGVALNAEGILRTGNIDLLVRRGKGHGFLVFEIKRGGMSRNAVEKAVQQCIRYAIALYHETTGADDDVQTAYRYAFGAKGSVPFKFGAVLVVEDKGSTVDFAREILGRYQGEVGKPVVDGLILLAYKTQGSVVDPASLRRFNFETEPRS